MTDTQNPSDLSVSQSPPTAASPDVAAFRGMTADIMQTIQSAKKEESVMVIEQTKIHASVVVKFLLLVFGFAMSLLLVGGLCVILGYPNIGSQVIMSSIAFLGGIGFGYGIKR